MKKCFRALFLLLSVFVTPVLVAQESNSSAAVLPLAPASGTLVVDIKPFSSEKELPKKVDKQLRSGGLEWGIKENELVFTMVNKQFIDFPINHLTRYGQQESLTLQAGEYAITGIGMEMTAGFNVQKILDRGAFVNADVLTFRIEPGKTTTLSINPVIKRDNAFVVDFYMPTMIATISNEAGVGGEKALNQRIDSSVAWPEYHGPLKFVPK